MGPLTCMLPMFCSSGSVILRLRLLYVMYFRFSIDDVIFAHNSQEWATRKGRRWRILNETHRGATPEWRRSL